MDNLQERLKLLRNNNKITQRQLAKDLNVSPSTIALYETGDRNPDSIMLKKIASYFNVSIDYLLGNTNIETPYQEFQGNTPKEIDPETMKLLEKIATLSEESKKDLQKQIDLLRIRDSMESTDNETSSTLERHA